MNEIGNEQELSIVDSVHPTRFSQVVVNHRELGHSKASDMLRASSPVRRNRPRISGEVQSQDKDIAEMLQKMQQKKATDM